MRASFLVTAALMATLACGEKHLPTAISAALPPPASPAPSNVPATSVSIAEAAPAVMSAESAASGARTERDEAGPASPTPTTPGLSWAEFVAAMRGYQVSVRRGNTLALGEAAPVYYEYLLAFHSRLHTEFASRFIAEIAPSEAPRDAHLVTIVEIVLEPDGTVNRLGVVKASGNAQYDFGAFNAVWRAAPYPTPPATIRSPDGRTYLRWALHRDESQCGVWNAEPYILREAPSLDGGSAAAD